MSDKPLEAKLANALLHASAMAGRGFAGFIDEVHGGAFRDALAYAKENPQHFEGVDVAAVERLAYE